MMLMLSIGVLITAAEVRDPKGTVVALEPVGTVTESKHKIHQLLNGVQEEVVTFSSRENVDSDATIQRKAVLIKRPHAKAVVLICHGFMCDKYDVSFLHMLFGECNTMALDFRAHGEDKSGQVCTFGRDESYDVIGAVEYIKNDPELKHLPLIVYGFSMGAVAAIIAQAREKLFDAMILDCPFDSSDKLLERGINQLKVSVFGYEVQMPGSAWLKAHGYSPYVQSLLRQLLRTFTNFGSNEMEIKFVPVYPEEAIKYIDIPCFFIACVNDIKAPEEAVLSIYEGAKGFKRCWIDTDGRKHYDTIFRQMHRYFQEVDRFVNIFLDGSYKGLIQAEVSKDKTQSVLLPGKSTTLSVAPAKRKGGRTQRR